MLTLKFGCTRRGKAGTQTLPTRGDKKSRGAGAGRGETVEQNVYSRESAGALLRGGGRWSPSTGIYGLGWQGAGFAELFTRKC